MFKDPVRLLQSDEKDFFPFWKSQIEQVSGSNHPIPESIYNLLESQSLVAQEQALISIYLSSFKDVFGELDSTIEHQLVRQFLFRYKMALTDDDVLKTVGPDDFIEIYDAQGIQIYRSWNFFKFCRYTIDQVLTRSWDELYDRPEFITHKLYSLMPALFGPEAKSIISYNIEPFILSERLIEPPLKYLVHMKRACPIEDIQTKNNVAFLSIASAQTLEN